MKISEDQFLKAELESLNLTMSNKGFVALAQSVSNYIKKFNPESVIDYGCGTGVYAEVMRQNGFNILAQDVFKSHRYYCKENYLDLKIVSKPKQADLMVWIEVAEHMTDQEIKTALEVIQPRIILFSSTPHKTENDIMWGHCNIKSESEWVFFMLKLGYTLIDYPKTPTQWALTFQKA